MSIWQLIALSYASIAVLCGTAWAVFIPGHCFVFRNHEVGRPRLVGSLVHGMAWPLSAPMIAFYVFHEHVKPFGWRLIENAKNTAGRRR